ncbi:MAG: aminopeptidase [Oligoflexia bacterium]|nr:aminopeptidase [Oligoflexia bacterium]
MGYVINSGFHQMGILLKKKKFERALQDPRLDEETKRKIRLVAKVKSFAEEKLSLTKSRNYESFVWLDDKYVVYAVTAAPKDSLNTYQWEFPIVGKVPYKGFFDKASADAEAKEMETKGFDTSVRGVTAYSTLGWFSDPLLSTMTWGDDEYLVETVIHELTHVTLFLKNGGDFNESLATFVGEKGAEAFYTDQHGPTAPSIQRIKNSNHDSQVFGKFIRRELARLESFYLENKKNSDLLALREKEFERIKRDFQKEVVPQLKSRDYSRFSEKKLNNAVLSGYKTYQSGYEIFERTFKHCHENWVEFFDFIRKFSESRSPIEDLKRALEEKKEAP